MTTAVLAAGIAGASLFVVVFLLDGLTRPGYHPVRQPVSALALGPRGWVQTVNFIGCGTLIALSAIGLQQTVGSLWLTAAVGVLGLGLVASGVFPMDPMRGYPPGTPDTTPSHYSLRHRLHDWAGVPVFAAVPAAAIAAALALDELAMVLYSALTALVTAVVFVWFGQAWEADHPRTGLIQRVLIIAGWSWLAVLCWSALA
ncbi:DUF998 domain-containing protein [Ruania suaedae]|uniref:DUF998 domain-containing protein n=1 Tax=Ruania suaedae TaxID=2897774 RepID=UPI001E610FDD|nr:DUF998 domain-containing protein [Ruania suaedae]UFU04046.1 DUF998 domain-containing protein [Ruania suaedae]